MITVATLDLMDNIHYVVKPTIFPDGTSQVWKLPKELLESKLMKITWHFENEREIIDLHSLNRLLDKHSLVHLHIPFLPYSRQDKRVHNGSTFNLDVIAQFINLLNTNLVTSVDVHNQSITENLITKFKNQPVESLHKSLIKQINPTYLIYPDCGAYIRYTYELEKDLGVVQQLVAEKQRDAETGVITGHSFPSTELLPNSKFLILDDICDGGATFISLAKLIKERQPEAEISLFVTHGIFSKGRQVLTDAGISGIYTTDSMPFNREYQGVFKV